MEITRGQWIIIILLTLSFIATAGFVAFGLAAVLSFGPAYLYLKSIRNAEETDREPWSALQTAFVWGAVSGVFYALILNGLGGSLVFLYSGNDADLTFSEMEAGFSSGHNYFDNIRHEDNDSFTMHYQDGDIAGNIFTHYWYTWKATSKKTEEEISIRGYSWMKWRGDKVEAVYNAFDPTIYNAQIE